ncbi:hypothetical protein BJX99DRAFT_228755 [Aspergillus californicus]
MDTEKEGIEIRYVTGFPSLADFIASDHDHSTFIYKRFDRLSARNLLYMQSELAELEALQDQYDQCDFRARSGDANAGRRDWRTFNERANDADGRFPDDERQMKLTLEIRQKLKEYKEALLLDSALLSMRRPSKQAHTAVHKHFWHEGENGHDEFSFPTLQGSSRAIYEDREDLVALVRAQEEDRLSAFLRKYCSIFFRERRRAQSQAQVQRSRNWDLFYISSSRIALVAMVLSVALAVALLFGSIFNLYYVRDPRKRLGIVAGYTVLFALCVTLLTNARRVEVFSASAAYAAVLVVFVSGDLNG